MLTTDEKQALQNFFDAVDQLKALDIIQSTRFLGDLGEFIATKAFPNLVLNSNKREKDYDAVDEHNNKYQIKYADGAKTNIGLGNPHKYDYVILIIGKNSVIFNEEIQADYAIYKLSSAEALKHKTPSGTYSFGKSFIRELLPSSTIR